MVAKLLAKIGLDPSEFNRGVNSVQQRGEELEENFEKLGKIFAAGALVTASVEFFSRIIEYARTTEGAIDENVEAVRRFGDAMDDTREGLLEIGVAATGTINRFGEWIGRSIAILQYGERQVHVAEQIEAQTRETLDAIEAQREVAEEVARVNERIAGVAEKRADMAFRELTKTEQLDRLLAQVAEKTTAANRAGQTKVARAEAELELAETLADVQAATLALEKEQAAEAKKAHEASAKAAEKQAAEEAKTAELLARYSAEDARAKREKLSLERQSAELATTKREIEKQLADFLGDEAVRRALITQLRETDNELARVKLAIEQEITAEIADQNAERERPTRASIGSDGLAAYGRRVYNDPLQQAAYERELVASETREIDAQIKSLQERERVLRGSGAASASYQIPEIRELISALRGRRANVTDYLFDPGYRDAIGPGIIGERAEFYQDPGTLGRIEEELRKGNEIAQGTRTLVETNFGG